jgi:ankyrin repeat protein
VSLLLRYGARIDARNSAGETALVLAVRAGQPEVARLLVDAGASPDALLRDE